MKQVNIPQTIVLGTQGLFINTSSGYTTEDVVSTISLDRYVKEVLYYEILREEKLKLLDSGYDLELLNEMLGSIDSESRKLAVQVIKDRTKYLGRYLEALSMNSSSEYILIEFHNDKHGRLL